MSVSINSYLKRLASEYYISHGTTEQTRIDTSVNSVITNLKTHFGTHIIAVYPFGSYKRDTMLPRRFDAQSDVDIMIQFDHEHLNRTPATYRQWIQIFAATRYARTPVVKDFPTIVIDMNHVKLDLVPAKVESSFWFGDRYYIPDSQNSWQETDPHGFNQDLVDANVKYNSIVKPIIRLLKAWNCTSDYPYTSFEIEQYIAKMSFSKDDYQTGFFYAIDELPTYSLSTTSAYKVQTLRRNAGWVQEYLDRNDENKAIEWLHKILP